jgi:DNA-binding CsgD family transcriptional regulator
MRLSPREQRIISLLASGHTDTGVATQLGLSVRTVAYAVRGLMERHGVQNRFQLGLVLGAAVEDDLSRPGSTDRTANLDPALQSDRLDEKDLE